MKTAVITGASTGIVKAVAKLLSKNRYRVVLLSRTEEKLKQVVSEISQKGGEAEYFVVDLSDINSIECFISSIKKKYEQIDAILNIAGVWHSEDEVFADTKFEEFDTKVLTDTYSVGFTAPSLLIHGLLPLMPENSHIINLSGTFENGAKGWLPYYASKKALEDFTYGLAEELRDRNILVNGISPSDTATEEYAKWFPQYVNEAIPPEEIAEEFLRILKSNKTGTIKVIKKYEYSEKDIEFLKLAIEMSHESYKKGAFPAGAVILKAGNVLTKTVSATYPQIIFHAESKAIDQVMAELNDQLNDCILYASMEPCLMCLSRAYWAGIRRIVFAVKKENVPHYSCYESNLNHYDLMEKFNEKIELVHIKELQDEAMIDVRKWLSDQG
jgi:short-subunit dehydrogenase